MIIEAGIFHKLFHQEGNNFLFKVSVKRDYKNKEGKYEWDNITFSIPKFNEGTIKFVNEYVKDGDTVLVQGHFNTYVTEKDGEKIYHEDKSADVVKLLAKKGDAPKSEGQEAEKQVESQGVTEADIDCEDVPF